MLLEIYNHKQLHTESIESEKYIGHDVKVFTMLKSPALLMKYKFFSIIGVKMKFMEIEKMSYIYVENMVLYLQLGIGNLEMELIMRQFQIIRGKCQIKNAVVFSKLCLILKLEKIN